MTDELPKTSPARPPRDNIVRAARWDDTPAIEVRDGVDGSIGTLAGHFSKFNNWYEINSLWEGRFLERVAPGAFKKTFAENRDAMRALEDLDAALDELGVRRLDVRHAVVEDRPRRVVHRVGGDRERETDAIAVEENEVRRRLEQELHPERVAVEGRRTRQVAHRDRDLLDVAQVHAPDLTPGFRTGRG